jgi:aryl-alcohol dehydrogenase-like predicted oxidoreductase
MIEKLVLGTAQFGLNYGINNTSGKPIPSVVSDILSTAFTLGIRMLDTAEAYGNAHQVIGEFHKFNQDRIFRIITKLPQAIHEDLIENKITEYLRDLHVLKIDVLMLHGFVDYKTQPELMNTLIHFKGNGWIDKIGLSLYTNEQFNEAIRDERIDVIQVPFNLLDNFSLRGELLKRAKAAAKIIHSRSVFLQGLFFKPFHDFPESLKELIEPIQQLQVLANKYNVTMNQLAIAYALSKDCIDGVLFGVDSITQLNSNIDYTCLPFELVEAIDKIKIDNYQLLNPSLWNIKK